MIGVDKIPLLLYYFYTVKKLPARFITATLTSSLILVSFTQVAIAQTTTPSATPTETVVKVTTTPSTLAPGRPGQTSVTTGKKAAFMEKLATIKDAQKKTLVEKIDTRVGEINQKRTTQMSQALMFMNKILTELASKAVLAKTQGHDTTKLNLAITAAQTAVKSAETAVATQAAKEYTITITTESALRTTVGATTRTLQTDLRNTHASVANAKQKVILAVAELLGLRASAKNASGSGAVE